MNNTKQTNYVVVMDFIDGMTLTDCCLLGWDNKTDWYDTDTYGEEILTPSGRVRKNNGCTIDITNWIGVYVSETESWCKEVAADGRKEGYDCTACKLVKNGSDYDLISVEDDDDDNE